MRTAEQRTVRRNIIITLTISTVMTTMSRHTKHRGSGSLQYCYFHTIADISQVSQKPQDVTLMK